jgi:hypothetical protein
MQRSVLALSKDTFFKRKILQRRWKITLPLLLLSVFGGARAFKRNNLNQK